MISSNCQHRCRTRHTNGGSTTLFQTPYPCPISIHKGIRKPSALQSSTADLPDNMQSSSFRRTPDGRPSPAPSEQHPNDAQAKKARFSAHKADVSEAASGVRRSWGGAARARVSAPRISASPRLGEGYRRPESARDWSPIRKRKDDPLQPQTLAEYMVRESFVQVQGALSHQQVRRNTFQTINASASRFSWIRREEVLSFLAYVLYCSCCHPERLPSPLSSLHRSCPCCWGGAFEFVGKFKLRPLWRQKSL